MTALPATWQLPAGPAHSLAGAAYVTSKDTRPPPNGLTSITIV